MKQTPKAVLTKYSHHFTITSIQSLAMVRLVENFYGKFAQWNDGKRPDGTYGLVIEKHFAVRMDEGRCFRFHINAWTMFCAELNQFGHNKDEFEIVTVIAPEGEPAELAFGSPHTPTADQENIHTYLMHPEPVSKLVTAQTGNGKTTSAGRMLVEKAKRILLIIRPMYIKKWIGDIRQLCSVPLKRIKVISGTDELRDILLYEPDVLPYDAIIISNKTLRIFLMEYIETGDAVLENGYSCTPMQMFARLGVDGYTVDECHQDFHLNYLIDLFTNVRWTLGMTATYMTDNRFIARMQGIKHPPQSRVKEVAYRVYMRVTSFHYWFKFPKAIQLTNRGSTNYSHTAYELSIMRNKETCTRYFDMVRLAVDRYWNGAYKKPGDRCVVFFATKDMCAAFVKYLRRFYPDAAINKYVEGDPYDNLIMSDIAVSTVLSAGTAHDIAQLTTAIMTIALSATHTNWQVLGRLRDLRDGRNPYFVYLVCEDYGKHLGYHQSKQLAFREKKIPMYSYAYSIQV